MGIDCTAPSFLFPDQRLGQGGSAWIKTWDRNQLGKTDQAEYYKQTKKKSIIDLGFFKKEFLYEYVLNIYFVFYMWTSFSFFLFLSLLCVCVCVCERERERETNEEPE